MKIKLSQFTPRKSKEVLITPEVSISIKITLENICLETYEIRKRETKEDIMLMLQKMMNLPQRESDKKVVILQVMKNMSLFFLSQETSHMEAMIGL